MKMLRGEDKIPAALERLGRLTKDEGLSVAAQTLGVVHGLAENMGVVIGGAPYFHDFLRIICLSSCSIRWKGADGWYPTELGYVSSRTNGITVADLRALQFNKH